MNHFMPLESLSLLAAFLAGLAGSLHCLAMCGAISGALSVRARGQGASLLRLASQSATYQAGRLTSYGLAGALIGGAAGTMPAFFHREGLVLGMRALAGLVLIGAAVGVLSRWRPLAGIERLGAGFWGHLSPLSRAIPANRLDGRFLIGMLWGWLPCGMVYSMLMVAALSGGAGRGAATMLCFGLGTLPAVLFAGVASAQILRLNRARSFRTVLGSLLLAFGVVTAIAPWTMLR